MMSIVCVYNNYKILQDFLIKSLGNQSTDFELILVDNTKNKYRSAAEALNYGGQKANGKYIMFVHQDVYLFGPDWLGKAGSCLSDGVFGVAGTQETGEPIGKVYHGDDKKIWVDKAFFSRVEVQTLDEQLLIIKKSLFDKLKFDEQTCDSWHLYGADLCLSAKKLGIKSYVLPLKVWHFSEGTNNFEYYKSLKQLMKKHNKQICLTSGAWYTNSLVNYFVLFKKAIKSEIGKWLGRNNVGMSPFIQAIKYYSGA